jgi:hypothetical protein
MESNIQLRRRERDRPHQRHDVLPQKHNNDIGKTRAVASPQHPSNARFFSWTSGRHPLWRGAKTP